VVSRGGSSFLAEPQSQRVRFGAVTRAEPELRGVLRDAGKAEKWFSESLGYPRPLESTAVDFILDLVSGLRQGPEVYHAATTKTIADTREAPSEFRHSAVSAEAIPDRWVIRACSLRPRTA
jgi:hypothetical protein